MHRAQVELDIRKNNLDLVRLFAAGLVIYSHSYVLLGLPDTPMLWQTPGAIGVYVFFAISGYLIARSWDADPHFGRFLTRRALRIFPALIVCVLLTAFVLGPLLTTLTLAEYLSNGQTWTYLQNAALHITYHLPGVFASNPFPHAINGSLWSLPVEFSLYLLVAVFGIFRRTGRGTWLVIFALTGAACHWWAYPGSLRMVIYGMDLSQLAISGIYFIAGVCFHRYGAHRLFSTSSVFIALLLLQALMIWPLIDRLLSWILLPWAVLGFGLAYSPWLGKLVRYGDYSYGTYIYAFPIQQTLVYLLPGIDHLSFLLLSFAITIPVAALSWHLIEKPALSLKPGRRAALGE